MWTANDPACPCLPSPSSRCACGSFQGSASRLADMRLGIETSGIRLSSSEFVCVVQTSDEDWEANVAILDKLLELDDVDAVYVNQDEVEEEEE